MFHGFRLGEALREENGGIQARAFQFTLLTGCRPGEALRLKWADVDLERQVWNLGQAKCGARIVYLGSPAIELLRGMSHLGQHVFPSPRGDRPMYNFQPLWQRLKQRAGLPKNVRAYDSTRHTFVTTAARLGVPRDERKMLVGHAIGAESHDRYVHAPEPLLRAADLVSSCLAADLAGSDLVSSCLAADLAGARQ